MVWRQTTPSPRYDDLLGYRYGEWQMREMKSSGNYFRQRHAAISVQRNRRPSADVAIELIEPQHSRLVDIYGQHLIIYPF